MFKDVAQLIKFSADNSNVSKIEIDVFVNKKSLTRQEFVAMYQIGLNASYVLEMRIEDYELSRSIDEYTNKPVYATKVIYDGGEYDIYRTFEKENGMIELTVG